MFEFIKSALRIIICHRSLYASLALAYLAANAYLDKDAVNQLIAGLYFLLMLRG